MNALVHAYGGDVVPGNMRRARFADLSGSVITSWLQKAIRRGEAAQARFAAAIKLSFCADGDPSHFTNLCNRLEIIAAEDVGLACPYLFDMVVYRVVELTREVASRRKSSGCFTLTKSNIHVILALVGALCAAEKNRNLSHIRSVCASSPTRDWDAKTFPDIPVLYSDVLRASKADVIARHIRGVSADVLAWFRRADRQQKAEWELAALLVCIRRELYDEEQRRALKCKAYTLFETEFAKQFEVPAVCALTGEMRSIVIDVHTGAKRKSGASMADFAERGAFVTNEATVLPHHDALKAAYVRSKQAYDADEVAVRDVKCARIVSSAAVPLATVLPVIPAGTVVLNFKKPIFAVDGRVYKFDVVGRMDYTMRCERVRKALGMEVLDSVLHERVSFTEADLAGLSYPSDGWMQSCARHAKSLRGVASVLVAREFQGVKLCKAALTSVDWWSLVEVMLFRRALGCTDTNGCNILISSASGRALSIDENYTNGHAVQHVYTAQRMPKVIMDTLYRTVSSRDDDVVAFVRRLGEAAMHMPELDTSWLAYCIAHPSQVFLFHT